MDRIRYNTVRALCVAGALFFAAPSGHACTPDAGSLLANGTFDGAACWTIANFDPDPNRVTITITDHVIATITSSGAYYWGVRQNAACVTGHSYRISFRGKTSVPSGQQITVSYENGDSPYKNFGLWWPLVLSTTWARYETTFVAGDGLLPTAQIEFGLSMEAGTVEIDDVVLAPHCALDTGSLLANGGFDSGECWQLLDHEPERVTLTASGSDIVATIRSAGDASGAVVQQNVRCSAGLQHALVFNASSDGAQNVTVAYEDATGLNLGLNATLTIAGGIAPYGVSFIPAQSDETPRLTFHLAQDAGTLHLDDVRLDVSIPGECVGAQRDSVPDPARWEALPEVSRAMRDAGYTGGEGGQWPQALAIDQTTGCFLLYGTDVGGLWRSADRGTQWTPCNVGFTPRGTCGLAIDPVDSRRCLAVGANSHNAGAQWFHGLYLSTDRGASWDSVFTLPNLGERDVREQIAYDPSSGGGGYCTVAYYSADTQIQGLYKTTDGGAHWALVHAGYGGSIVKVHPTLGYVYLANKQGFFRSEDGGITFTQTVTDSVQGLDVVGGLPDNVYINRQDGAYVSTDKGVTFAKLPGAGFPAIHPRMLKVSPADPNHMVIVDDEQDYVKPRYYSTDGGGTWARASVDTSLDFLPGYPANQRLPLFAWDPADPYTVWSFGSDWPTKSTNGGATWIWAGNGDNGICTSGTFNFNVQNPDLLFVTSLDYGAAFTLDGGYTWTYTAAGGNNWGGTTEAGYAADASTLVCRNRNWPNVSEAGTIVVSHDGGAHFTSTQKTPAGRATAYGDPTDAAILFAYEYRSTDRASTWSPMTGCDGVWTSNPGGQRELYGTFGRNIVRSTDHGASWTTVASTPYDILDLAYDPSRERFYIATGTAGLAMWQNGVVTFVNTPSDQFGAHKIKTVAVDPVAPNVVYAGGPGDLYASTAAVVRSTDAGATWTALTGAGQTDGGHEAWMIRVHPVSRYAYVGTGCYGMWRLPPPVTTDARQEPDPASDPPRFSIVSATSAHGVVTIRYSVPLAGTIALQIYDVAGRLNIRRERADSEAGTHALRWRLKDDRGRALPSGVYFIRATFNGTAHTLRFVNMR
jgi:hypothetical protein